jgi:hypothetical protein
MTGLQVGDLTSMDIQGLQNLMPQCPMMPGSMPTGFWYELDNFQGGSFKSNYPQVVPLGPTTVSPEHAQSMSEKKWQELLCIIKKRFSETSHLAIKSRDELMEGNVNDDEHILIAVFESQGGLENFNPAPTKKCEIAV